MYLETVTDSFLLLTVNDVCIQNDLIQFINSVRSIDVVFNLAEISFRDSLNYFDTVINSDTALYVNFDCSMENLDILLEKINLARDLLLHKCRVLIFIVPVYVRNQVQLDFPDLYSYFHYREDFIMQLESITSYILPWDAYLNTKEVQHILKQHYISSGKTLEEKIKYFRTANMSSSECKNIMADLTMLMRKTKESEYDRRYVADLLNAYAKVLLTQGMYVDASLLYEKLSKFLDDRKDVITHYQVCMGKGDISLAQGEYDLAIEAYSDLAAVVGSNIEYPYEQEGEILIVQLYERNALCYALQKNYMTAIEFMDKAEQKQHVMCQLTGKERFAFYYNYLLILLAYGKAESYTTTRILEILDSVVENKVQLLMYKTLCSWYNGVLHGSIRAELANALETLRCKREVFIENDKRIAESHYIIATLFMLSGNFEKAEYCCSKAKNILSNYTDECTSVLQIIQQLENRIKELV